MLNQPSNLKLIIMIEQEADCIKAVALEELHVP